MKRTKLNPYGKKRAAQHRAYMVVRDAYMREHPNCEVCGRPADDLHHRRGRAGKLLKDRRFFMAVCRTDHDWIHAHPEDARAKGLISSASDWNRHPEGINYQWLKKELDI
jgi:hypothetical protein